jgi:hypothetical protein
MSLGNIVLGLSVLLYLVAGVAFILQGRGAFGIAWICYALANAAFVWGSIRGGL